MKKTYEMELPEGYKKVYSINRKDKQIGLLYTIFSIIPITVLTPIVYLICYFSDPSIPFLFEYFILFLFFRSWFLVLVFWGLHFLFEGIACKIIHHKKATQLTNNHQVSHGIYNVYIHKKAILCEILITHIIFTVIYLAAVIFLLSLSPLMLFLPIFTFSAHIPIYISDFHILYALLFKCKDKNALYFDNGVVISFYTKTQKTIK